MNLYQLASQDEAWGAYALDDDPTPWTDWPAEPPAPVPPGPVPLDAALDAAAREYGVDADVLRALGPGGSVDSIFDTAASLRSRLEAFGGDYAQALASYRQAEEGQGSNIALAAPALADAQTPAPGPAPEQAPSAQPTATTPRPRPARPPASTPVPGPLPSHAARPDQPPAPPDGRLGAADDPRSLLYRPAPAAQKPLVDEVKSQLASGAKTLARMLPGTSAAAHWVATQGEPVASKAAPANVGSVLERVALPTADLPSRDLPLRPETRKAANNAWDAASPQDRQRMQALPGWQGQLARERAAQFAQADKGLLAESPTAALFDTRVEGRTRALIAKGEHPDFAQRAAREGAAAGVAPGQEVKALGSTVQQAPRHAAKVPVPAMTPLSVAQDVLSGALQMGPTAAKGGADIVRLATGDVVGKDFSDSMAARAQTIKDMVGSDRARAQEHNLQVDWADPNVSAMEMLARNKGAVSDKLLPSAGSMLLPAGVATGAGKAATVGRAALALDRTALAARVASAQTAAGIGATAAQNAADVFTGLLDKGHSPEEAYTAAGISVPFSIIAGKLTGGGAETALARQAMRQGTDKAAKGSLASGAAGALNAGVRDGTQEVIEDSGQMVGEAIATDVAPTANEAAKRGLLAFTMGTAMGGGMHAAGATHAPRVQNQATTPQVPRQQDAAANMTGPTTKGTAPAAELARSASTGSGTGNAAPAAGQASAPDMAADPTGEPAPGAATWSDVAAAAKKGRAEAEILRQAAALPEQNAAASTPDTTSRNTPSATPAMAATAAATNTDTGTGTGSTSHTRQRADTSPQEQASSDAGQAGTSTQAGATDPATNAPGAPAPTPSAANAEADASAAEAAPATTQNAAARHTAAAQIQPPATAPIEAQIQALDSGMLVVGGDQATILAHLQAGGVRGAEPFAGVTLVPVDQAALAQQVLSRPLAAPAGPVGTQADRGSQRASAAATLPRSRTAAQLAPAATQAPTAGGFTAGPLTEGRHGSPASAAASQPAPVMEMQRDGTLMVKGDPVQLQERLRQGGVERVLRREGGVLVGLDQVGKARQLLQQPPPHAKASADPSPTGQQFSRSPPDRPSRARGLPSKPATVQSVRAAVAKLTNSMGLLAEGRGRVVVATSADIQAHWQPLVGEVDMGSQDTGLAQGFFDPNTNTVFLIADHIEAGQEMAVAAHELVHKHGQAVLGEARWRQLHEVIGSWANRPEGSLERRVYDEAMARVQASRPDNADAATYSSEELFPYAVQVAMELGVQPTALMPNNSVQGWLARVRASLKDVLGKLTGNPQAFDGQDLVDLAFGIAQLERSASAPSGLGRPNGSAPSAPYLPIQMSRTVGEDDSGDAPEKASPGTKKNPLSIPFSAKDVGIRESPDGKSGDIFLPVGEAYVNFAYFVDDGDGPALAIGKNEKTSSGYYVTIDSHGVTEAALEKLIAFYIQKTGHPPTGLPGHLIDKNLDNFQKEFNKHREINHNGTTEDWAQAAIRDISFGRARQKLGYGVFDIRLGKLIDTEDLKDVPQEVDVISRRR